jgi:predicted metal-dependent hydrolase
VQEKTGRPWVELSGVNGLVLSVPVGSTLTDRAGVLYAWYRQQMQDLIPPLLNEWQPRIGEQISTWGIKRMKTRWGSCNTRTHRIWLNLELVKYPPKCLEYVLVHELVHLLEPAHNARFYKLMEEYLPHWRDCRDILKQSPPLLTD